ncbi:MAG: lipase family protein [Henriciella sp.]
MTRILFACFLGFLAAGCAMSLGPRDAADLDPRFTLGDGGVSDFYTFSDEIPAPGQLLRQETLNAEQRVPNAAKAIRLLYSSSDGLAGTGALVVSGALFFPEGEPPEGGWPLLLWSHGTVGIADKCAPTWTGYVPFHDEHLSEWLNEGYAIVASDYQGLGTKGTHPYLATRPAAYSNLDVIRAVQSADFPVSDHVVLAGQSQGAGAAIATAGYAPTYAPEIDIRAVIATGVPFFTPDALLAVQAARPNDVVDPMLGYNFLALTLIEQIDPNFAVEDYVSEQALPLARAVTEICNRDMRAKITEAGLTYDKTFTTAPTEPLRQAFERMQFPSLQLSVPVFVGVGSDDRDTPPRMQSGFVKAACAAGSAIEAHLFDGFDHLTVLNHSQTKSKAFASAAFSGDTIAGNCDALPF